MVAELYKKSFSATVGVDTRSFLNAAFSAVGCSTACLIDSVLNGIDLSLTVMEALQLLSTSNESLIASSRHESLNSASCTLTNSCG